MTVRTYTDRCPGVLRPWIADDGALVRLRLIGGRLQRRSLRALIDVATEHADGTIHLTKRSNLQLRGIAHSDGCVAGALVDAVAAAGLLPSPAHELVRNIMVSPLTGRLGGRVDLRPVADELDAGLCSDPAFARLAGRFLFVLDDGRGDVAERSLDLGLVALDGSSVQLRIGTRHWGPTVALADAPRALLDLTRRFLVARGEGETALWHVDELPAPAAALVGTAHERDARTLVTSGSPPFGILAQDDGRAVEHVRVPDGVLTPQLAEALLGRATREIVVTPWRSVLLPDLETG